MSAYVISHFHNDAGLPVVEIGQQEFTHVGARGRLTNNGYTVTAWAETNIWHGPGRTQMARLWCCWAPIRRRLRRALVSLGVSGQLTRNISIFASSTANRTEPAQSLRPRIRLLGDFKISEVCLETT